VWTVGETLGAVHELGYTALCEHRDDHVAVVWASICRFSIIVRVQIVISAVFALTRFDPVFGASRTTFGFSLG